MLPAEVIWSPKKPLPLLPLSRTSSATPFASATLSGASPSIQVCASSKQTPEEKGAVPENTEAAEELRPTSTKERYHSDIQPVSLPLIVPSVTTALLLHDSSLTGENRTEDSPVDVARHYLWAWINICPRLRSSTVTQEKNCARNMSETTTEVVEEVSSSSSISSAKLWQKWSITNLQGFLPFLPKVPAQKESVGLLQQLSPRAIKSECVLTRHLLTSNLPGIPSTNQAGQTARVQTIRAATSVSSPTVSSPSTPKKNTSADSILSVSFASLALLTGIPNLCPEFLRRLQLTWGNESFLTTLAVYSGLLILAIEGSGCLFGLVTGSMPPGLVFMVSALLLMMVVVCLTIGHDPNSPDQSILSPSPPQRTSQRNLRNER